MMAYFNDFMSFIVVWAAVQAGVIIISLFWITRKVD